MKKYSLLIFIILFPIIGNAQNWGTDSLLNPSFANDNRFNKTLDLSGTQNQTPDVPEWTQDLIMYMIRLDKFGVEPTINSAREKLWVLEKLGITGVHITPVAESFIDNEKPEEWGFYSFTEPDNLEPMLGTEDDFKALVDELHARGIKVFLDFEFHGVFDRDVFIKKMDWQSAWEHAGPENTSSLLTSHPEFFKWITDSYGYHPQYTGWNTAELIWKKDDGTQNEALKDWYRDVLVNDWIAKYDLDGLRLDLEPFEVANVIGYDYWQTVIDAAKVKTGKTIVLIPEDGNAPTNNVFAFAQENFGCGNPRVGALYGSHVKDFMVTETIDIPNQYDDDGNLIAWGQYFEPLNIVDEVKNSDGDGYPRDDTYYTTCISAHDRKFFESQGHLVYFGYGALFQPFIPYWAQGDEFNTSKNVPSDSFFDIMYFSRIDWNDYTTNQDQFNEVRKMIYIRKKYKNLIGSSTHKLSDKPMVKIDVVGIQSDLPSYGYYSTGAEKAGIIVLGTKETDVNEITVNIPLSQMQLVSGNNKYEFHNLMTDTKQILSPIDGVSVFKLEDLEAWGNLIYKIEPYTNSAPSCYMNTPVDLHVYNVGDDVNIKVDASDIDGTISKVEFYLNSNLFFTDSDEPYEFSFKTDEETALGTYKFYSVAYDDAGNSTQSNIVIATLKDDAQGIKELENDNFELYPNPSRDYIIVGSLDFDNINNIEIFDVTGKCVKQIGNLMVNKLNVDISDLEIGLYFVRIKNKKGIAFKRFLKN
jgi:hypothetical protein